MVYFWNTNHSGLEEIVRLCLWFYNRKILCHWDPLYTFFNSLINAVNIGLPPCSSISSKMLQKKNCTWWRGKSVRAKTLFHELITWVAYMFPNCIKIVAYLFSNCINISLVYSKEPSRCRHSTQYFLTSLSVVRCLNISYSMLRIFETSCWTTCSCLLIKISYEKFINVFPLWS